MACLNILDNKRHVVLETLLPSLWWAQFLGCSLEKVPKYFRKEPHCSVEGGTEHCSWATFPRLLHQHNAQGGFWDVQSVGWYITNHLCMVMV